MILVQCSTGAKMETFDTDAVGLPPELVATFNSLPDDAANEVSLSKRDIELLINSLAEMHRSYAAFLQWEFVTHGQNPEMTKQTGEHASRSYSLFVQFAQGLMSRFVEKASDNV
jgi:hypothetical protein